MRQRIRTVMKQDSHVRADGTYLIRSIYFDNVADKALYEKCEGVAVREKFRIRYYNDDLSFFMLEIADRDEPLLQEFCLKCTQQYESQGLPGKTVAGYSGDGAAFPNDSGSKV